MAVQGRGDFPFQSIWLQRRQRRNSFLLSKPIIIGSLNTVQSPVYTDWFFESPSGNRTATLNITEADDTLSSNVSVSITATLNLTEAADTLSSAASVNVSATLSVTESVDTVSGAASVSISGTLNLTEANDTFSGNTSVNIAVSASLTEDPDTLTGAVFVTSTGITADLSVIESSDTITAIAVVSDVIFAALSIVEMEDTPTTDIQIGADQQVRPHYPGQEWQLFDKIQQAKRPMI